MEKVNACSRPRVTETHAPGAPFAQTEAMLAFNPQMFVRIQQLEGPRAPMPRPLDSGFSMRRAYRVLGIYNPSETSDAYFILPNDREEIWFICQRHLRFAGLHDTQAVHLPLPEVPEQQPELVL